MLDLFTWGTPVEVERHRRIRLTLWAYAYEIEDNPLVADDTFDAEARKSDCGIETGHLDHWWRACFNPSTGIWIHMHPELQKVKALYGRCTSPSLSKR